MRRSRRGAVLVLLLTGLWAGCGSEGESADAQRDEAVAPGEAEAMRTAAAEIVPAASEPSGPIRKAPTTEELLRSCAVPEPQWDAVRADAEKRAFAALDALAETTRAGYAQTSSCEPRVWILLDYYQ